MQIHSIRLENVRRFTDPVEITDIGPGLNVLSAHNEHGKSTIFDALHAAFFLDRKSMRADVASLIPHAGGDPEVTVSFSTAAGRWKLLKRWSRTASRKEVKLWKDDVLVGQEDQAESMLSDILKAPKAGGPAGLLWVRQGLVGLEEKGDEQNVRRDLLSSVTGEVEAMTGGRKMDGIRAGVKESLARYLTSTGRPKKDGDLARAQDRLEDLDQRHSSLKSAVDDLSNDLGDRRRLRGELEELEEPEERERRSAALKEAETALADAERATEKLNAARETAARAKAQVAGTEERLDRLTKAISERDLAEEALRLAQQSADPAKERLAAAETAFDNANRFQKAAEVSTDAARAVLKAATLAKLAASSEARRTELREVLSAAEAARKDLEKANADIVLGPDTKTVERIAKLAQALEVARIGAEASAPSVTVSYTGDGRVRRDGEALKEDTRIALPNGADLEIDGVGRLLVQPGSDATTDAVSRAERALSDALEVAGFADRASLDEAVKSRVEAEDRARNASANLKAAAPDGIEALQAQIAAIPEPAESDEDLPTVGEAEAAEAMAIEALSDANVELEKARTEKDLAHREVTRASTELAAASERNARATQALESSSDPEKEAKDLEEELTKFRGELANAIEDRVTLEANTPDVSALKITRDRARTAIENARIRVEDIRVRLAELDTRIRALASDAVEEELADVVEKRDQARATLTSIETEVAVLRKLLDALDAAREEARERYVEPVLKELRPLIDLLWPEAELQIDAETVMPTKLVRRGTEEDFDVLSGGTREQIALLVRLAFAQMLAKDGRPAPVILDDAIVYTDDERIETMFDTLNRQALDFQVIVFSCRQRAFRDLGGTQLSIETAA
ncbi:AAA family ATPase [Aliiruegeria lutimaris]|uniref:DNA repair exonuclease SbcCD ATPase subunit n=1 Tax=Aliiruegeria lutimaris TaxID=571298 RepID=A0A1G8WWZ9_9RHOB|nr:AAA family ATPase [Aliiruegeria lutimaris]SDJ82902.1 DNA repair exonuclease SbcCD ATPase subunit [Aliiruegeria lutimaris]